MQGGLFTVSKFDTSSVPVTLVCVAFFWALITGTAVIFRRLLFHVYDAQHVVPEAPIRFAPYPQLSRAWNKLHQLIDRVRLNQALLLALLDLVATVEVCACSLECWPVRAATGQTGLLIAIALNGIRGCLFTCRDAYGNPCSPWYRFLQGRTTALWLGITWAMQLLGASFALRLAQAWWSLNPTVYHTARYDLALLVTEARLSDPAKQASIPSDLQVSAWLGFLIEATGTFVDFVLATVFACAIGRWNERRRCPVACSPTGCTDRLVSPPCEVSTEHVTDPAVFAPSFVQFWGSFALRLCINLALTAKWIGLTGLYVNPANAFIQSWGLGGVSPWTHLCVYWLGPLFGVWLAVRFEHWFNRYTTDYLSSLGPKPILSPCLAATTTSSSTTTTTTSSTQTVPEELSPASSYGSTNTSSRGSYATRWIPNPLLRGLVSPSVESHLMSGRNSSVSKPNGASLMPRLARFINRASDVSK